VRLSHMCWQLHCRRHRLTTGRVQHGPWLPLEGSYVLPCPACLGPPLRCSLVWVWIRALPPQSIYNTEQQAQVFLQPVQPSLLPLPGSTAQSSGAAASQCGRRQLLLCSCASWPATLARSSALPDPSAQLQAVMHPSLHSPRMLRAKVPAGACWTVYTSSCCQLAERVWVRPSVSWGLEESRGQAQRSRRPALTGNSLCEELLLPRCHTGLLML
jgi:hypothetical protein